jgi:predicted membrane protein
METNNTLQHLRAANRRKIAFGALALFFGFLWLLRNLDIFTGPWAYHIFSWQSLVIAIGLIGMTGNKGQRLGWSVLVVIGLFFLLDDIYNLSFRFQQIFWPLLLMFVGLTIILKRPNPKKHFTMHKDVTSADVIDDVSIFGGSDVRVFSKEFRGGEVTAIFGGSKIDMSEAKLAPGIQIIELTNIFGGNNFIIPSDWNVKVEVTGIMGGFKDNRVRRFDANPESGSTLIIRGVAIFGGGEVKSI